jgi:hypothetical protein
LVIPDRALGLPVLRALSLCTCCRQYPGAATRRRLRSSHPAVSAFPEIAVGSACTSSFSRLARRSLALRPAHSRRHLYVTCYTEGFSHFVSSMTAPVASGWSVHRVGLSPTGKRRLLTAHANSSHVWMTPADQGLFSGVAPIVGAVMSPAFWCGSVPLALMLSADPLPQSFHRARTGAGGFTGFRINPLPAHHLLVTLDPGAALVSREPYRRPATPGFPDRSSCCAGSRRRCAPSCWQARRRPA